ncbi:MAG: transglycosylase domain-containing protein [Armatimonadetes bacterium]|nr:transglycosylase domain-containing protein [Armatimonadota bacterium]
MPKWLVWTKRIVWTLAGLILLTAVAGGSYVYSVMQELAPRVASLAQLEAELKREPTLILSADGEILYRMAEERREPVGWPELSQSRLIVDATVAAEDKRFWKHEGVDHKAILRALWVNFRSKRVKQGGSTITQQVAKRLLTSGERTLRRKLEDACLAVLIERELTKEQVITLYLNQVYYGAGAYGVKTAADVYFAKKLDELTPAEAALLSRLPRRPSDENPFVDPEAALRNRNIVLRTMLEEGWVTRDDYDAASEEPLKLASKAATQVGILHAPYFVTYVLDQARRDLPNEDFARGGYRIYTTLRMDMQREAEAAVRKTLEEFQSLRVTEGALVVMDHAGQIVAMVGGSDFKRSQFNIITQGRRQPGSAFKPIVYSTAIELGYLEPTSLVPDEPFVYRDPWTGKVWRPRGGGKGGYVSVQTAIVRSVNIPAVHTGKLVTPGNIARFAKDVFGIRSPLDPVLPLALGSSAVRPIEMAEAFSVFATGGNRVHPYGIKSVSGTDGQLLRDYRPRVVQNVLSSSTVGPMRDILRRVVLYGTGTNARKVINAAGKTGTANEFRDAWFCGFTDKFISIAWVANATYDPNRTPAWKYGAMKRVFGGKVAAKMWAYALEPIQKLAGEKPNGRNPKNYPGNTAGMISVLICTDTCDRAIKGECPKYETRIFRPDKAEELLPCGRHGGFDDILPPLDTGPARMPPLESEDQIPEPPPVVSVTMVTVEICIESGELATLYCPVKRPQEFKKGSEPNAACRLHRP